MTEIEKQIEKYRQDFPILERTVRSDKKLCYLDSAATTLKPQVVCDRISEHYLMEASNVHRGLHYLSEYGTQCFEETRRKVQKFINAPDDAQCIFTSGTTASTNLVAQSYGKAFLKEGDEIVVTAMEHHSNIVPWQMLCESNGCVLKVLPMNDKGELIVEEIDKVITEKTKFVSCVYVSNSLGTINPVRTIIAKAKSVGAKTLLDSAQAIAHMPVDVQELDCDFLAFSGHKMFGPTGIGVLYGKRDVLDAMPPVTGGGDMIESVTFEKTTYAEIPAKFEAGTPHIAGVIGLGAAIDYINQLDWDLLQKWEDELLAYGTEQLSKIQGLKFIGQADHKASVLAFIIDGLHPHDLGTMLDQDGIAIRTGHHCTQPVMDFFQVNATSRASLAFYNNKEDIDRLVQSIQLTQEMFV